MTRICHLYDRTSAADAGESAEQRRLPALRRHAAEREWTVPASLEGEFVDVSFRDDAPRLELQRLTALLVDLGPAAAGRVVLTTSLNSPFRSIPHMVDVLTAWHRLGVVLVALDEPALDGTTTTGQMTQLDLARIGTTFEERRHSESIRGGIFRKRMRAAGKELAKFGGSRGKLPVDKITLKRLYEGRPFRSVPQIVAYMVGRGATLSAGTANRTLQEMREAGQLDEDARAQSRAKTKRKRGGRPLRALQFDEEEIRRLRAEKLGPAAILLRAKSLPSRTKREDVRLILKRLGLQARSSKQEKPIEATA